MPVAKDSTIVVPEVQREEATFTLLGSTGLFCHRMSAKAKKQLMLGGRKKTAAERLELKHDPRAEFRASMHVIPDMFEHTDVVFPAMALKAAMATAALVVAGVKKTDVQRLVYLPEEMVPIYGVPRLRMDITRSADINRTPDVRTRAFFPRWATQVRVMFTRPQLSVTAVAALLQNAGMVCGIGDFRQEKGKGSFGTFSIVSHDDLPVALLDLPAQRDAIASPQPANIESAELLAEFDTEVETRK